MQIKVAMEYHLTLVRMDIIKNTEIINAGENIEKRKPLHTNGENINQYSHDGKKF